MANTIRHKRGTSDPDASDLSTGEIAFNTATGKGFTKTDGGDVAGLGDHIWDDGGELDAGVSHAPYSAGTKSSGTFTLDVANGNMQTATNGGAHTLQAPTEDCVIIVHYTNNGSAGAITLSGYDSNSPRGDDLTTANGDEFILTTVKINGDATLTVQAL